MTYDRRDWEQRQLEELKQEISKRLRPVCEGVPTEEFDQLVERIARIKRKYEQRSAEQFFPHPGKSHPPESAE